MGEVIAELMQQCCLWRLILFAAIEFFAPLRGADAPDAASADLPGLIVKLGDADGDVRKAAAWRLREIGRPAIPALRAASDTDDPQVREAVRAAISAIDRPPIPDGSEGHGVHKMVAVEHDEVSSTIDIIDGERTARVHQQNGRYGIHTDIRMIITGPVDGKPTRQTIEAGDAEELKWKAPEAWKIYAFNFNPENEAAAVNIRFPLLEMDLKEAMAEVELPDVGHKAVEDQFHRFTQAKIEALRAIMFKPQTAPQRIADSFGESDALRDLISRLKLRPLRPGAELSLERAPQSRLGIYMSMDPRDLPRDLDMGLVVAVVAVGSRAERAGVKPLDVIQRVNGRSVFSPQNLPAAVEADPDRTTIEVVRDGKKITLHTK